MQLLPSFGYYRHSKYFTIKMSGRINQKYYCRQQKYGRQRDSGGPIDICRSLRLLRLYHLLARHQLLAVSIEQRLETFSRISYYSITSSFLDDQRYHSRRNLLQRVRGNIQRQTNRVHHWDVRHILRGVLAHVIDPPRFTESSNQAKSITCKKDERPWNYK